MPETKARRLAITLDEFISSSPDVEAAAVVSFDGLPMASALPDSMEEDRVGAMSAALLSLGEQAAIGLGRGQLNQVFVEGEHGYVFLMSARDQAVLAAVARHSAKIGFMLFEMRRAAERIGDVLLSNEHHEPAPVEEAPVHAAPEPAPVEEPQSYAASEPTPADEPPAWAPSGDESQEYAPSGDEPSHVHAETEESEPAPWSRTVPEEHDLSAGPADDTPAVDEDPPADGIPGYRPDADRAAAPWH